MKVEGHHGKDGVNGVRLEAMLYASSTDEAARPGGPPTSSEKPMPMLRDDDAGINYVCPSCSLKMIAEWT